LKAFTDEDFAGDNDTRISVTAYKVYFKGIPVNKTYITLGF